MGVNIPAVVLGALLGILTTGFAFALTTGRSIVSMGAQLQRLDEQVRELREQFHTVAEWRLRSRGTT